MLNWLADRWNDLIDLVLSLLLSLWDMLNDLICFIMESFFSFIVDLVNGLNSTFTAFNITNYLSVLPDSVTNMMSLVGVNDVSKIIVSALIIRFILGLIPFVRIGG